jgi:hypothetical protein
MASRQLLAVLFSLSCNLAANLKARNASSRLCKSLLGISFRLEPEKLPTLFVTSSVG